jgi:hypothetical protein
MISKDQSIVTQVAAKIAAELIVKDTNTMSNIAEWLIAFDAVSEALNNAHGFNSDHGVEMLQQTFPNSTMEEAVEAPKPTFTKAAAPQPMSSGTLVVAGKQHGDLPNWLVSACKKAGVGRVWDNRDQAVGTKRPWFKQADAVDGQEPAAFWPPKSAS